MKEGEGHFWWQDGSEYQGEFSDNFIHGHGWYRWSDAREYTGQWKHNRMNGQGIDQ